MDGLTAANEADGAQPHPSKCAALLRQQAPVEGWTLRELAERIHAHCGHSRLRAHRLARGWTIAQAIAEMTAATGRGQSLDASRVSHWERGDDEPSPEYRDALCRLYQTGPVDLGLAADYGRVDTAGDSIEAAPGLDLYRPVGGEALLEKAGELRQLVDETLSGSSLSDATVEHYENVAEQYGRVYKTQPVGVFIANILDDLREVRSLTNRRLPQSQRRDLCGVIAKLAGLVSMTMVNAGRPREAREWVHTARLAADEAGDPTRRAWVALRGAVASLHFGDPVATATAAHEAQVLTNSRLSDTTAMAWAVAARALALTGDHAGARAALRQAEVIFDRTTSQEVVRTNTAYTFTPGQLHFYRANALTALGDTKAARDAQDTALAIFDKGERLDPSLVHLDRALCLIQDGDVTAGAVYASQILLGLRADYRPAIVFRRGVAVADAVPADRRHLPAVRTLHEVLALGPAGLDG
ncbi:MAG: helix-turn-helix transcriptional regulator [Catenulispora sp.]|nr:helix-turn-helix transcriptional regulator [Catenulispora sp.]NUT40016.1 helix-turn-helix transcriptional regulator [Thermoactinospora sp.]